VGLIGILLALREYDVGRFIGLTQVRLGQAEGPGLALEPLVTSGLHRYVRHPLYSASILFLAGGATNLFGLTTMISGTAYFAVGLKFEERKLGRLYGKAYDDYRRRTPALIPFSRPLL
jgi:protein-S-isoprenylcysteine O-methyltransferase Ste14